MLDLKILSPLRNWCLAKGPLLLCACFYCMGERSVLYESSIKCFVISLCFILVQGTGCSTNYAPGMKSGKGCHCAETICPPKHQGKQLMGFHRDNSLSCTVQLCNCLQFWPIHWDYIFGKMKSVQQHEDSPADIHVGRGNCLPHSLWVLPYQFTIHSTKKVWLIQSSLQNPSTELTGREDYCPLAIALAVVHEKNTNAPRAVYTNLHSARGLFHMWPNKR
jgi:hypothetical protein